jgi:hypothetical protein
MGAAVPGLPALASRGSWPLPQIRETPASSNSAAMNPKLRSRRSRPWMRRFGRGSHKPQRRLLTAHHARGQEAERAAVTEHLIQLLRQPALGIGLLHGGVDRVPEQFRNAIRAENRRAVRGHADLPRSDTDLPRSEFRGNSGTSAMRNGCYSVAGQANPTTGAFLEDMTERGTSESSTAARNRVRTFDHTHGGGGTATVERCSEDHRGGYPRNTRLSPWSRGTTRVQTGRAKGWWYPCGSSSVER